jgi:hypothetical protein
VNNLNKKCMNNLILKDCPADLMLDVAVYDYNGTICKRVTLLLDSQDDWSELVESDEIDDTLGYFGGAILKAIIEDPAAKVFVANKYQIINGVVLDYTKPLAFVKDGKTFKRAWIDKSGVVYFKDEDENKHHNNN